MILSIINYQYKTVTRGYSFTEEEKLLISNYAFLLPVNRETPLFMVLKYIEDAYANDHVKDLINIVRSQNKL